MTTSSPARHVLSTQGVTSEVRESGDVLGHVVLIDYDDRSYASVRDAALEAPGVNVLWRSSPGCYHLWSLAIREDRDAVLASMAALKGDGRHGFIGWRRGRWTLRIGPKTHANAEDAAREDSYKEPPEPVDCWVNPADGPCSLPHIRLAAAADGLNERRVMNKLDHFDVQTAGDAYRAEAYHTVVDELQDRE